MLSIKTRKAPKSPIKLKTSTELVLWSTVLNEYFCSSDMDINTLGKSLNMLYTETSGPLPKIRVAI